MTPRQVAAAATAASLTALLLIAVIIVPGRRPGQDPKAGGTTPPAFGRHQSGSPSTPTSDTLSGTLGPGTTALPTAGSTGTPVPAGSLGGPFLATGSLQDRRVLVTDLADVIGARGTETTYRQRLASPVVGSPWTMVALPGRQLALTSTDLSQLVLLTDGLTKVRTLDMRRALSIPADRVMGYGSLSARDGIVYGAVAWDNDVAAFAVDVRTWTVRASRRIEDIGQFPHTCLTDTGLLAVLTHARLTLFRTPSLDAAASARLGGTPLGLACAGRDVVVSDDLAPRLTRFDASARSVGTVSYDGSGAAQVIYADGVVFGADEVRKTVFRCVLASASCTISRPLDGRPYSLLRAGNALLVGMQIAKQIVVLDPATLAVRGTVPFPGMPRAFAVVE